MIVIDTDISISRYYVINRGSTRSPKSTRVKWYNTLIYTRASRATSSFDLHTVSQDDPARIQQN